MNHRGAFFCLDEDKIKLQHKKSKQDLFEKTWKVRLVDRQFSVADKLNVIGISPALFAQLSSFHDSIVIEKTILFPTLLSLRGRSD